MMLEKFMVASVAVVSMTFLAKYKFSNEISTFLDNKMIREKEATAGNRRVLAYELNRTLPRFFYFKVLSELPYSIHTSEKNTKDFYKLESEHKVRNTHTDMIEAYKKMINKQ